MTNALVSARVATPLGTMRIVASDAAVVAAHFEEGQRGTPAALATALIDAASHPVLRRAAMALQDYFASGTLDAHVPLAPDGTPFQKAVWDRLADIPAGCTRTYRDIAADLGRPQAARAVGAAIGRNPVCVFLPCHRVIGTDGTLTGYAGGLARKRALLALEARHGASSPRTDLSSSPVRGSMDNSTRQARSP